MDGWIDHPQPPIPQVVVVRDHIDGRYWTDELSAALKAEKGAPGAPRAVLGLDVEWKPTFAAGGKERRAAVLQVAGPGLCLVMQLKELDGRLPRKLKVMLRSPGLLKVRGWAALCTRGASVFLPPLPWPPPNLPPPSPTHTYRWASPSTATSPSSTGTGAWPRSAPTTWGWRAAASCTGCPSGCAPSRRSSRHSGRTPPSTRARACSSGA